MNRMLHLRLFLLIIKIVAVIVRMEMLLFLRISLSILPKTMIKQGKRMIH